MKHKKQRGQKRKLNALLANINQIQPFKIPTVNTSISMFHVADLSRLLKLTERLRPSFVGHGLIKLQKL